jgi:hypothetical protein
LITSGITWRIFELLPIFYQNKIGDLSSDMTETERKENLAQITSQDLIGEYY